LTDPTPVLGNNKKVITQELDTNTFEAGLIHQPKYLPFWESILEAPHRLFQILKNGRHD
jgi:hypothetical protein